MSRIREVRRSFAFIFNSLQMERILHLARMCQEIYAENSAVFR
jgi:hypothetical protein